MDRKEYFKKYHMENRDKINARSCEWQKKNRDRANANARKSYAKNKERSSSRHAEWVEKNSARDIQNKKDWYQKNKARILAKHKEWVSENRCRVSELQMRYQAAKLGATTAWLTDSHKKEMRSLYSLARDLRWLSEERIVVDHIVPLQGKTVCGLHVPWNLRLMTNSANIRKNNKLIE